MSVLKKYIVLLGELPFPESLDCSFSHSYHLFASLHCMDINSKFLLVFCQFLPFQPPGNTVSIACFPSPSLTGKCKGS